jgi:Na+-translocating ferredoxin:NAD+ oxidoreductase RnfD subunit
MFNEIKKYLTFKTILDKFVLVIQIYIALALINLIDFSQPEWWKLSVSSDFYKAFAVVVSIFLVDIAFFSLNFYVLKHKGINLLNVGLTGAFTFMVLHPLINEFWLPAFSAFVAIIGRYFIRYKGRPVFNPAALGMYLTYLITLVLTKIGLLKSTLFISWWAADFGKDLELGDFRISIYALIFLPIFFYFVYKFRRHWLGITFFVSLIVFQSLSFLIFDNKEAADLIYLLSGGLGTWLFMSFLMVIEPKTSPAFKNYQIILGIVGSLTLTALNRFPEIQGKEILTILFLNILSLLFTKIKLK